MVKVTAVNFQGCTLLMGNVTSVVRYWKDTGVVSHQVSLQAGPVWEGLSAFPLPRGLFPLFVSAPGVEIRL